MFAAGEKIMFAVFTDKRIMFAVFVSLLSLSFMNQGVLGQAGNSTRNDTGLLPSRAADTTRILGELLDGYDKRLRPDFGGSPCKVNISIHVLSMVPIKEIDMEVTIVMFLRQHWIDSRLAYGPSLGIKKLKLLGNIVDQVWLPDMYFVNDLSDKTTCGDFMFEITQEGIITHSCRKKVRLYCPMNLRKFPMDEQACDMNFESYSYTMDDIILDWLSDNKGSVRVSHDLKIPQYNLVSWEQTSKVQEYSTGNFSTMSTKFLLQRQLGYYILQEFIPTVLIVALSWVGFWIDERSVPARVSLGITTVLAITTLMFGIQSSLPRVGHVKAIDVYLLGNFLFVFAALIEFAFICSYTKVFSLNKEDISKENPFRHSSVSPSAILEEGDRTETDCKETGILQRALNETKEDNIQVKDCDDQNYKPSISFEAAFHKPPPTRPLGFIRKPLRTNSVSVKLPKRGVNCTNVLCEPCTVDKLCRKLFPLAYALFLSIYFAVYFFADV